MQNFEVYKEILPSGLSFIHIKNPNTKAFEISLYVKCGTRDEKRNENGIAHFLEHMLFRGSKNYKTSIELSKKLESFGGEANATTSIEMTNIWLRGHQLRFEEALECFLEFIYFPVYSDMELERSIIIEEMASDYNDAGINIDIEFRSLNTLFPNSALGRSIIGTQNSCKSITIAKLEKFRSTHYAFSNSILAVVSHEETSDVLRKINNTILKNNITTVGYGAALRKPAFFSSSKTPKILCISNQDNQFVGRLSFAFEPLSPEDHVGMCFLQRFMDDGISSHLPSTLRETLGLVYDISADYTTYSDFSLFQIDFTVSEKNLDLFLQNFFEKFNLDSFDLQHLKHIKTRYLFDLETSMEHPSQILNREIYNLTCSPQISLSDEIKYLNEMNISKILKVWNHLNAIESVSFVLIGPKAKKFNKKINNQLAGWRASNEQGKF